MITTDDLVMKAKEEAMSIVWATIGKKAIKEDFINLFDIVQKPLIEEIERLKIERDVWRKDFFRIAELERKNKELSQELKNENQGLYSENVHQKLHIEQLQEKLSLLKSLRKSGEKK